MNHTAKLVCGVLVLAGVCMAPMLLGRYPRKNAAATNETFTIEDYRLASRDPVIFSFELEAKGKCTLHDQELAAADVPVIWHPENLYICALYEAAAHGRLAAAAPSSTKTRRVSLMRCSECVKITEALVFGK